MNSPARVSISPTSVTETSKFRQSFFKRVSRRFSLKRRPKFTKRKRKSDKGVGSSTNVIQDIESKNSFHDLSPTNTEDFLSLTSHVSTNSAALKDGEINETDEDRHGMIKVTLEERKTNQSHTLISPLNDDDFITATSPSSTKTPPFENEFVERNLEAEYNVREVDWTNDTVEMVKSIIIPSISGHDLTRENTQQHSDTHRHQNHSTPRDVQNESDRKSSFGFNDNKYDTRVVEKKSAINHEETSLDDEGFCTPKSFVTTGYESNILPRIEHSGGRVESLKDHADNSSGVQVSQGTMHCITAMGEDDEQIEEFSDKSENEGDGTVVESFLHDDVCDNESHQVEHIPTPCENKNQELMNLRDREIYVNNNTSAVVDEYPKSLNEPSVESQVQNTSSKNLEPPIRDIINLDNNSRHAILSAKMSCSPSHSNNNDAEKSISTISTIGIQYTTSAEGMILHQRKGLRENMRVAIIAGNYMGKFGTVVKFLPKKVRVLIDNDKARCLSLKSIMPANIDNDSTVNESKRPIINLDNNSRHVSLFTKASSHSNNDDAEKSISTISTIGIQYTTSAEGMILHQRKGLRENMRVAIIAGNYMGKFGTVVKFLPKKVRVLIDNDKARCLSLKSVMPANIDNDSTVNESKRLSHQIEDRCNKGSKNTNQFYHENEQVLKENLESSKDIIIVNQEQVVKQRAGSSQSIRRAQDLRSTNTIHEEIGGQHETTRSKNVRKISECDNILNNLIFPDRNEGGRLFGNGRIMKSRLSNEDRKADTFLSYLIGNRLVIIEIPLENKNNKVYDTFIEENGSGFELLSVKIQSDKEKNFGISSNAKVAQFAYAQVFGPNIRSVNLEDWLCRLGDFSHLTQRKLVARLDLLQSPAYKFKSGPKTGEYGIIPLELSIFREIEEDGHVGCGFICEDLLFDIMGGKGALAKRTICIQVRIYIPTMGIYKGMLMKKKMSSGSEILLPLSMKKVDASRHPDRDESSILLITQAGVDQSQNCHYIGRLPSINKDAKAPPEKSFKPKELSKMITRLFQAVGVPKAVIDEYRERSKRYNPNPSQIDVINHAYVRGVIDPTGLLPPDHVFLSGVKNENTLGRTLFVTRSPCIRVADGRLLEVVRSKPKSMDTDSWNFLKNLPFGVIIFAKPKRGLKSTPELIANGDLDGDRFFCCWNKIILSHMTPDPIPIEKLDEKKKVLVNEDSDWWKKAQERMTDIVSIEGLNDLISKLYTLSEKAANKNEKDFMRDSDAGYFAEAFNNALENGKHGTKIELPVHLHEKLPVKLRKFLVAPTD